MPGGSSSTGGFNAFFYSLVSSDTRESYFSTKRQQYLIDQGYTFKVVQDLADRADKESIILTSIEQEMSLLNTALTFRCDDLDTIEKTVVAKVSRGEMEEDDDNEMNNVLPMKPTLSLASGSSSSSNMLANTSSKRKTTSLGAISAGAEGMVYSEFQTKR